MVISAKLTTRFLLVSRFSDGGMHELISMSGSAVFAESGMELIDIGQIADKVPLLPQLYAQGPPHAFFVVKHWGDLNYNRNLAMAKPSIGQQAATFAFSCRFESLESFAMEVSRVLRPNCPSTANLSGFPGALRELTMHRISRLSNSALRASCRSAKRSFGRRKWRKPFPRAVGLCTTSTGPRSARTL